jgi:magnesium-transporting ATPase (P-type)
MDGGLATRSRGETERVGDGRTDWHSVDPDAVLQQLQSGRAGLEESEARKRLEVLGPNVLQRGEGESPLVVLWRQINSPLIWVLVAAAALAVGWGRWWTDWWFSAWWR